MPARDASWFFRFEFVHAKPFRRFALVLLLGGIPWPVVAQAQSVHLAGDRYAGSLRQTVLKSGMIFDGMVTGVVRETGLHGAPLAYRISFQVKHAMRGVSAGSVVTIREWAGLWTGRDTHEPRYRIGEHAVLFLYPPGAGGLTSPVGGSKGKLVVDRAGQVALPMEWAARGLPGNAQDRAGSISTRSRPSRVPLKILVEQVRLAEAD